MANLVLGPLLRYVGQSDATVWVETDASCEVEALGHCSRTFHIEGRHYALVHISGLEPGQSRPYEVKLDGERVWPAPDSDFPPSTIRTIDPTEQVRLMFGSCRVSVPHGPPYSLRKDEDKRGREMDALYALALRMRREPEETWPHTILFLGDQVYADEVSPGTREFIDSRHKPGDPPSDQVANFEEYAHLYRESWQDPALRWLLSTVSSAMIFDDHDVHDDWNTSEAWVEEMRARPWWDERIVGAFMSYWIYQHLGNLSPEALDENELYRQVREAGDAGPILREYAFRADREREGTRWSFHRDLGSTRLVMLDSRAGRVLTGGRRCMVDDREWSWIESQATGGFDHLLFGTSLPYLLGPGMHYLEAWNEAVCAGAWGGVAAVAGEKVRQALDLEHWAAFGESFDRLTGLIRAVGAGERGREPASISVLSGDVHHAYLARVAFRRGAGVGSAVYQAVCSPFRNPLDSHERRAIRAGWSRWGEGIGWAFARAAGLKPPDIRWRLAHDAPWFDNQVATLELKGRGALLRIEKTIPDDTGDPRLETVFEHRLA